MLFWLFWVPLFSRLFWPNSLLKMISADAAVKSRKIGTGFETRNLTNQRFRLGGNAAAKVTCAQVAVKKQALEKGMKQAGFVLHPSLKRVEIGWF